MSIDRGLRPHQVPGYEYAPPNLAVNPGFDIWQRGSGPFASATARIWGPDEWLVDVGEGGGGGQTLTCTEETTEVLFGDSSAKLVYVDDGTDLQFSQVNECVYSLLGKWVTFSCWVKCSVADNVYVGLQAWKQDTNTVGNNSDKHSGGGSWEQLTAVLQIPDQVADIPGLSWGHVYPLLYGVFTEYGNSSSDTVYVDGASLVVGKYPEGVPFIPLDPSVDLNRCKRYYQTHASFYTDLMFSGDVTNGSGYYTQFVFPTPMQATPTITLTNRNNLRFPSTPGTPSGVSTLGFYEPRTANGTGRAYYVSDIDAEVT